MALRARSTKRTRPQAATHASVDNLLVGCVHPSGLDGSQDNDQPRSKRAMVSADLHFLEKIPPLRDYHRSRFGRRGGVDGGAPDSGSSLWMRALEESMEETSFVTREAPTRAAMVAPVPMPVNTCWNSTSEPATLRTGRRGVAAPISRMSIADDGTIRRRRFYASQAAQGNVKDDEARPATEGFV